MRRARVEVSAIRATWVDGSPAGKGVPGLSWAEGGDRVLVRVPTYSLKLVYRYRGKLEGKKKKKRPRLTLFMYASPGPEMRMKPMERSHMVLSWRKSLVSWLSSHVFFSLSSGWVLS